MKLQPITHEGDSTVVYLHDMLNQINNTSHKFNKGKPGTGHKQQDLCLELRKNESIVRKTSAMTVSIVTYSFMKVFAVNRVYSYFLVESLNTQVN